MNKESTQMKLREHISYSPDSIVSKKIIENSAGGITLFAFDKGQRLSEHTSPYDAVIQIIEGEGEIIIGGKSNNLTSGELIIMPANIAHAVNAHSPFKMLLTMIKSK